MRPHKIKGPEDPVHKLLRQGGVASGTRALNRAPKFPASFPMHNQAQTQEMEDI